MIARCALLVLVSLALAAPAFGADAPPQELWREYPLFPTETGAAGTPTGPLTPPVQRDVTPDGVVGIVQPDESGSLPLWWLVAAAALVTAPLAVFLVRRRLEAIPGRAAVAAWRRKPTSRSPHSPLLERFAFAAEAMEGSGRLAAVECVVRREGSVRSRFVAEVEPQTGRQRTIASSRTFWRRGYGAGGDRDARRAWEELIGGLEANGWQIAPAWGAQAEAPRPDGGIPDSIQLVRRPAGSERAEPPVRKPRRSNKRKRRGR